MFIGEALPAPERGSRNGRVGRRLSPETRSRARGDHRVLRALRERGDRRGARRVLRADRRAPPDPRAPLDGSRLPDCRCDASSTRFLVGLFDCYSICILSICICLTGDHKYSHVTKLAPQKLPALALRALNMRQARVRTLPLHLHARELVLPDYFASRHNRLGPQRDLVLRARLPDFFLKTMRLLRITAR